MNLVRKIFSAGSGATYDGTKLGFRDPDYIRAWMPGAELASRYYFRVRTSGLETIPEGPVLFVGNHSGGLSTPDAAMAAHAVWSYFGVERPIYALVTPLVFGTQPIARHLMRVGGLAASSRMAHRVLESGASMLIYPGGGDEAYRSYRNRHKVDLRGQSAYVRLAMRFGVPIVPIVCCGGHNTLFILSDGEAPARMVGLDKLGVTRVPILYSWPFGITAGIHHSLPFPARIDLSFGPPITLEGFTPAMTRDRAIVAACHDHVQNRMQVTLDALVDARKREKKSRAGTGG